MDSRPPFPCPGQLPATVEALQAVEASELSRQASEAKEAEEETAKYRRLRGPGWKPYKPT